MPPIARAGSSPLSQSGADSHTRTPRGPRPLESPPSVVSARSIRCGTDSCSCDSAQSWGVEQFRSGDPLFTCNGELEIVQWNRAAEQLTGISATEAVGRRCWQVLCGVDDTGQTICHAGCTSARLARERWPVACQHLLIKTRDGKRRVAMSTITAEQAGESVIVHIMRRAAAEPEPKSEGPSDSRRPMLTPRQREVLAHLAQGRPAKRIARRLGITEATTRNHIRAILLELGCHSQLEAVAAARRHELV